MLRQTADVDEIAALADQYPGLTRTTGALLVVLMRARGRTLDVDTIIGQMDDLMRWDYFSDALRGVLKTLRKIIKPHGLNITTIYGIGLRLEKEKT